MQKLPQINLNNKSKTLSKKPLRSKYYSETSAQHNQLLRRSSSKTNFFLAHLLSYALNFSLFFCFVATLVVSSAHASAEWQHERELYKKARAAQAKKKINEYHKYSAQLNNYPLQVLSYI